jgi:hypothetical protein
LWILYGNPVLDPDGNGGTNFTFGQDDYFHAPGAASITLLNATADIIPSCRYNPDEEDDESMGEGGGEFGHRSATSTTQVDSLVLKTLENITADSITNPAIMTGEEYIGKTMTYRTIEADSAFKQASAGLSSFYSNSQNNSMKKFVEIENDLANRDFATAQNKLSSLNVVHSIETNYKNFYLLYMKSKDTLFTVQDSVDLINLANLCPFVDGGVVYQARGLYNHYYNTYKVYRDTCAPSNANSRPAKEGKKKIAVILKSELFPNPNDGTYTLKFNIQFLKQQVEILILDMMGRRISRELIYVAEGNEMHYRSTLINGTYLVKINLPDGTYDLHRLIIDK